MVSLLVIFAYGNFHLSTALLWNTTKIHWIPQLQHKIIYKRSYNYKQCADVMINSKHNALISGRCFQVRRFMDDALLLRDASLSQYHPIIIRDRLDSVASSSSVESIGSNFYLFWQQRLQIGADWSGFLFSPPNLQFIFSSSLEVWHLLFSAFKI